MKNLQGSCNYKAPTGETVTTEFEYPAYESIEEAIAELTEGKVLAMVNQTKKEDISNVTRENSKVTNGHSTRKVVTEEEKAERKLARQADKALLQALKAKGLTADDIASL